MKKITLLLALTIAPLMAFADPFYEARLIYEPTDQTPDHVHASCIVECPNGDLMAVWYENGSSLPEPYFSEQGDKSDDVRIGGARLRKDADAWEPPFIMADTFGVSDNNPAIAIDKEDRLWLVYATLLGVPENTWGSALVRYRISTDYEGEGPPHWSKSDILVPHPTGFQTALKNALPERARNRDTVDKSLAKRLRDPLTLRLGWMPRAHPIALANGAMLLPLANENHYIASMAITHDAGETWTISDAVPFAGVEQPTVAQAPDGTLTAFFRSSDDEPRIRRSTSTDNGMTWSEITLTDRLHPGAGIDIIYLKNGHLALIYNDDPTTRGRLTIAISPDHGETWPWSRALEDTPDGRYDYPSLIQAQDGTLHATYSYNLKTIKHTHLNEDWVQAGN